MAFIVHNHYYADNTTVLAMLEEILNNQKTIIMTNAEIKALAEENKGLLVALTDAINLEQEQIALAIQKLNDIIANGGTEEERQEIADILTSSKTAISEAIADIQSTIADQKS